MSDVSTAENTAAVETGADGEGQDSQAQAKSRLSPDEYERRLQSQGRDLREQRRQIRELTERIASAGAAPATRAERAAEPDLEADPMGWMKYARARLQFYEERESASERQQAEIERQNAEVSKIARSFGDAEKDFAEDHPDYYKAAEHFRKARTEELAEEGVASADMGRSLQQDFVNIIARATRAGKDPAEVIYGLAKRRGFGADGDDKKLATIDRASRAGRTLSGAGGSAGENELTLEYVNTLKGKAFTEARAKLREQMRAAERRSARG